MKGHTTAILTVNRRLARTLKSQATSTRILAFEDFLLELFELQRAVGTPCWRLSPLQERVLWADAMKDFKTLGFSKEQTIDSVRDAYARVKAYQLTPESLQGYKEDSDLFVRAMIAFEAACASQNAISPCALIEHILSNPIQAESMIRYDHIIFDGFEEWTPSQERLIKKLNELGVKIDIREQKPSIAQVIKTACADVCDEITRAAHYAKSVYEKNETMAIVVPQLQSKWHMIEREMAAVFNPGHDFPGMPIQEVPYNISSGASLAHQPIMNGLMQTFELLSDDTSMQSWRNLLHSPFIRGGVSEQYERAKLDLTLHDTECMSLSTETVINHVKEMPAMLMQQLQAMHTLKPALNDCRTTQQWVLWLKEWISLWGWAQERTLSSAEYQAVSMFYETIPTLYQLDVFKKTLSLRDFLNTLHYLLKETIFQIETQDKKIQVLGLLEAAGLQFDHIWIVGLNADVFPPKANPHPFIPVQLQIQYDMPHSTPGREVRVAKRLLDRLMAGANQVVVSYAMHDALGELQLESPFIALFPIKHIEDVSLKTVQMCDLIALSKHSETYSDDMGLPLTDMHVKGGSRVFKDQGDCPQRAYLKHRLKACAPKSPVMGLSAAAQGILVHAVLENIWKSLKDQMALLRRDDDHIKTDIDNHVEKVLNHWTPRLSPMNMFIEAQRLSTLVTQWMQVEKSRDAFSVVALEEKLSANISGIHIQLKIDRIDALENNQWLLMDYKTGEAKPSSWEEQRMDEPQLPLYAIVLNPSPSGIAFAVLKRNQMMLQGVSTTECAGIKTIDEITWQSMLQSFRDNIDQVANEFKAGFAAMHPKNGLRTCETCELQVGCRQFMGGFYAG